MLHKWKACSVHPIPDDLLGLRVGRKEIKIRAFTFKRFLGDYLDESLILTTPSVPDTYSPLNAGVQGLQ